MGIKSILKEEFQLKNLKLNHNEPKRFVEWRGGGISVIYTLYRLAVALYFTIVMFYSWTVYNYGAKWIVYLTNWSMAFIVLTSNLLAFNALKHYIQVKHSKQENCQTYINMPVMFQIEWVMYNVNCVVAPMITLLYWGVVWTPDFGINVVNVTTHAMNSVYLMVDLLFCNIPTRLLHYYHPNLYALSYAFFSAIYWAAGGTGEGTKENVYEILDYNNAAGKAVGYLFIIIFVLGPIIMVCVFIIYKLREKWRLKMSSVSDINVPCGEQNKDNHGMNNINNSAKESDCVV